MEEAESFQHAGVYATVLGDFVMEVIAEVLCCQIMILADFTGPQTIPLNPKTIKSEKTVVYVAYSHCVPHYDITLSLPILPCTPQIQFSEAGKISAEKPVTCRCGVNKSVHKSENLSCINNPSKTYVGVLVLKMVFCALDHACFKTVEMEIPSHDEN